MWRSSSLEAAPVEQPRERVVVRHVPEARLGRHTFLAPAPHRRHVDPRPDHVRQRAARPGQAGHRPLDQPQLAILGPPVELGDEGRVAGRQCSDGLLRPRSLGRGHQVEQRVRSLELGLPVAEQLLAGAVPAHQPALGIHHHDQGGSRIEHSIEQPFFPETEHRVPHGGCHRSLLSQAARNACPVRQTFARMDLRLLDERLESAEAPRFRARQVWEWAARGATSYDEMTNLPRELRERLAGEVPFSSLRHVHKALAPDGTEKALFETHDGRPVEAVLMRYRDGRRSLCVSSQSGCPLTCTFCATGTMRFGRNLTAFEILDQALHFRREDRVDHAVFMGMGEPMMNLDAVLAACRRLPDLGITHRRTAVSTVGWIPGIDRLAESGMPIRLALSLHAADDALRSQIMPVNDRYPLADVLAACRRFHEAKRKPVFVEYVMLKGVNDRYEQALALAEILDRRRFKVNLIPYNPTGMYDGSSREAIAAFRAVLEEHGLDATVRLTRGRDIDAACGQLAAKAAA